MKQSKSMSMVESIVNVAVGYGIAVAAQTIVYPLFGIHVSLAENLAIGGIITVISIARSYLLRRVFEALHIRRPLTPAMSAVIAERYRQIDQEGWSAEHDDIAHAPGELAHAGACYAYLCDAKAGAGSPVDWPWADHWWKPTDFRRNLVKSAALILAEIEKFDRARRRK